MEAFFGCATTPNNGNNASPSSLLRSITSWRNIRRNFWSSNLQEEDEWIDALLSLMPSLQQMPSMVYRHRNGMDLENNNDCALVKDATDYVVNDDDTLHDDGVPNIPNTVIPKIIHFIWLGGKPIPPFPLLTLHDNSTTINKVNSQRWNECMQSWAKHHPSSRGWTIQLWTEENICSSIRMQHNAVNNEKEQHDNQTIISSLQLDVATMQNSEGYKYAMKIGNYGMASDILRLEILNKVGGVYVDIDYWCVDSLEDIFASSHSSAIRNGTTSSSSSSRRRRRRERSTKPVQFFCGASNTGCIELNNGLLGCRHRGHPIVWNMMHSIHSYFKDLSAATPPLSPIIPSMGQESMAMLISSFLDTSSSNIVESMQQQAVNKISSMEVIENTGPGLLTRSVCRWIISNGGAATPTESDEQDSVGCNCSSQTSDEGFSVSQVVVFPSQVFHPFPNCLRNELQYIDSDKDGRSGGHQNVGNSMMPSSPLQQLLSVVKAETKAVHLWGCSWQEG